MPRVLIINDSRFERLFLKDLVAGLGYEAFITDEYGSWRQLENLCPDLVIVNYTMGEMTGDQLISRIKAKHPTVKCLLSSCSRLNPQRFPQVDGLVQTPVQRQELQQILGHLTAAGQDDQKVMETAAVMEKTEVSTPGYQYCPFCGQELKHLTNQISFCPFCGQKLAEQ